MGGIIWSLLLNSLKAIVGKIAFAIIGERFLSQIIAYSLRKLAKMTTNELDDKLAEEIIKSLKRDDLPELK
ncbi:hypothetical protein [uncultured Endozoicomonas sp.]|uniref:hypothetical protein n=1 Tax=uncultured Endozoicomonas sp. TaxID=432652 RepID=UPI0026386D42|nr:hypothetical protein [uncultured Endozoicomonas sp.]